MAQLLSARLLQESEEGTDLSGIIAPVVTAGVVLLAALLLLFNSFYIIHQVRPLRARPLAPPRAPV